MKKYASRFIILIVLVLIAQTMLILTKADAKIDNAIEDLVYQSGSSAFSTDIYVIGIDAQSMSEYGQYETWSRSKIAELINVLCADKDNAPAVIGLDIGYFYERGAEEDQALVEAVENAGNVVLIETYEFTDKNRSVHVQEQPFEALREAAAGIGFSNTQMDDDGVMRHAWGQFEYDGQKRNSFAMEVYRVYLESQGLSFDETANGYYSTQNEEYYLIYAGKGGFYYGSAGAGNSISRVLSGEIPASAFKDAIVLVGAYAESTQDNYFTANDKTAKMYGVEIHANAVNQLINGDFKTEMKLFWRLLPTLTLGVIALFGVIILNKKRSAVPIVLLVLLGICYVLAAVFLFDDIWNLLIPIVEPVFLVLLLAVSAIVVLLQATRDEKDNLDKKFSRFLSPAVAKAVRDSGDKDIVLEAKKVEIAVLFVDIRGFTTISEKLDPTEVVAFLNEFYKLTTKAIFDFDGTVDKYIGDNTMGFFNAPVTVEDFTYKAVKAALQMTASVPQLDEVLSENLRGKIGFGVGVHLGEAVVGYVGTPERMEYTALGDTVNVASRLEGQAGPRDVIVSEDVYNRLRSRFVFSEPMTVQLKGKSQESKIYKVLGEVKNE